MEAESIKLAPSILLRKVQQKSGHAKKTTEIFQTDSRPETRIQQAHLLERDGKSLIESSESLATLTKYDVHNTFEADHIKSKVSFIRVKAFVNTTWVEV